MNITKHLTYWILPTIFVAAFIVIYYYDFLGLAEIIAPEFNRELGLLENVQVILIIGLGWLAIKGLRNRKTQLELFFYGLVMILSAFVLLEEIDYGLHIPDYLEGRSHEQVVAEDYSAGKLRNFHNQGDGRILHFMKLAVYISMVIVILILPFITRRFKRQTAFLQWLTPSHYLIYTLIAMAIINRIALYVDDIVDQPREALTSNVAEFEEVFIYYIAFLYLWEITKKNFVSMKKKQPVS